ncbi:Alanine racemase [Corynebacterium ciconiae DSM 44920]|uniref:alanine racemase n=1 Tax=Corynebacterium ciconiae TaxID=227319 RepID=UPI00037C8B17|nr:alanine racemase [Corynebacterium ciconiae]WKD60428.1 Alanine racemase [Corynebacterium ciconiae DSM 44920]
MDLLTTTIDLEAIAHNTRTLKARAGNAQLIAVVKADAYGHGMAECAAVMAKEGADMFGVATLPEALELVASLQTEGAQQPVLCWLWHPEQDLAAAIAAHVVLGVANLEQVRALIAAAGDQQVRVHVKVDTGLNRSGVDEDEWEEIFNLLAASPKLQVEGIFSHLACADEPGHRSIDEQAECVQRAYECAQRCGLSPTLRHVANSPATLTRPDLYFEAIRPGLALYGISPIAGRDASEWGLIPAMRWTARVTTVKKIQAGEGVSYGLTWRAPCDSVTAVVAVGYADGMPRAVQTRRGESDLWVSIHGHRYRQIGRVCMDQIVVDLGSNPHGVSAGDEAVLMGDGQSAEMTAAELAAAAGTIAYEMVCAPKGRTVRHHLPAGRNNTAQGEKADG